MPQVTDDKHTWYTTEESLPDEDTKVLAMVSLPTGSIVLMPGTINEEWFT